MFVCVSKSSINCIPYNSYNFTNYKPSPLENQFKKKKKHETGLEKLKCASRESNPGQYRGRKSVQKKKEA
jgi:hypothetical protein